MYFCLLAFMLWGRTVAVASTNPIFEVSAHLLGCSAPAETTFHGGSREIINSLEARREIFFGVKKEDGFSSLGCQLKKQRTTRCRSHIMF